MQFIAMAKNHNCNVGNPVKAKIIIIIVDAVTEYSIHRKVEHAWIRTSAPGIEISLFSFLFFLHHGARGQSRHSELVFLKIGHF